MSMIAACGKPVSPHRKETLISTSSGLDLATNKLHWLMCGFEGAVLIMNSDIIPNYPAAQRQPIADRSFATMFAV